MESTEKVHEDSLSPKTISQEAAKPKQTSKVFLIILIVMN